MDQCAILYVKPGPWPETHAMSLRALGFAVDVVDDLPPSEVLASYHGIVVRAQADCNLAVLGARLRAKPHFGRRVLIALVADSVNERQRRDAAASGFDVTLSEHASARDLAAHILRRLRPFPEYRCLLRTPNGRRKAA